MRKHIWLDEYTLDSVSWDDSASYVKLQIKDKYMLIHRSMAEKLVAQLSFFLQDTDRESKRRDSRKAGRKNS